MMVSNSTKARVEGTPRGLWLRPSVGWSGARSWVSRHPTRSFIAIQIALESDVRIEANIRGQACGDTKRFGGAPADVAFLGFPVMAIPQNSLKPNLSNRL